MDFYLKPKIDKCSEPISYGQKILMMGSCFSNHMASKMEKYGFDVLENPYGIMYNPLSILNGINDGLSNSNDHHSYLVNQGEMWHNLMFHGEFSSPQKEEVENKTEKAKKGLGDFLNEKPNWLILTFGSAYTWTHIDKKLVATNCHKLPNSDFKHSLLDVKEITLAYKKLIEELRQNNPHLKIIFTVSPVRHLSLGLHKNNLSKATLHLAIHQLCEQFKDTYYFPSYELVMDNLRDYRFFKSDKTHPNEEAINFVWDQFLNNHFDDITISKVKELDKILNALNHKPIHSQTKEYENFTIKYQKKLAAFLASHKEINL